MKTSPPWDGQAGIQHKEMFFRLPYSGVRNDGSGTMVLAGYLIGMSGSGGRMYRLLQAEALVL